VEVNDREMQISAVVHLIATISPDLTERLLSQQRERRPIFVTLPIKWRSLLGAGSSHRTELNE
jgi:hypothetical protein